MLLATMLLSGSLGYCSIQLPCAAGDPSCSPEGLLALVAGSRPPAFLVGTGNGVIYAGSDQGDSWRSMPLSDPGSLIHGFGEVDGAIVAFGSDSGANPVFYVSRFLQSWEGPYSIPLTAELTYGGSNGVAVYAIGADRQIVSLRPDGSHILINTPAMTQPTMLEPAGAFWFLGDNVANADRLRYSLDGVAWNQATPGITDQPIRDIVLINTIYATVGQGAATTFYSILGNLGNWGAGTAISPASHICMGEGVAVAGTDNGSAHQTSDGQNYGAAIPMGLSANLQAMDCNGATIVSVPQVSGNWALSRDSGASWQAIADPSGGAHTPLSVAFVL